MDYPILSLLIWLPLLGAALITFINQYDTEQAGSNARSVALWISGANLVLSLVLLATFQHNVAGMQFQEQYAWIRTFNIQYHLGVDGISVLFVVLTALLTPICILVSWESIERRVRLYMASFLALEGFVIGVFCALDFVLFYTFWEAMLIPMFLLIGIWGGENRTYAALKFFLYTFAGSVLMLVAIMYLYHASQGSFSIVEFAQTDLSEIEQRWLWLAFFAAFAVKVPMWPFHTWLPDAHVQAPTAASVFLAGILLKMGAYGFMRISLPMFPDASLYFAPMMFALSAIAIVWGALAAFAQTDVKKMIAYSSVSHMGFITLGIFAGTEDALQGAVLQMINHGIVSAGLFMLIGVIYDRMHTRNLAYFGGIVNSMPVYAFVFMVMMLASVALPGTNNFIGEFLVLSGSYGVAPLATTVAVSGVVLGALYMLWLYRKMILGEAQTQTIRELKDMNGRERFMFVPLVLLVFYIGVVPNQTLNVTRTGVQSILQVYHPEVVSQPVPSAALNGLKHAPAKGHHVKEAH